MRKFIILFLSIVLVFLAGLSFASHDMKVHWDSVYNYNFTRDGSYETAQSTEFDLTFFDYSNGADWLTNGFCVDLDGEVRNNYTYEVNLVPVFGNYQKAAWLYDTYKDTGQNAPLQLAIWEAVYETRDFNSFLESQSDTFWSGSTYATQASSFLNSLNLVSDSELNLVSQNYLLTDPLNDNVQSMIVQNPVPIPGAIWLLGTGLLGLIGFRRVNR